VVVLSPIIYMVHGLIMCLCIVALKWLLLGKIVSSKKYRTYGFHYYLWNMVLMIQSIAHLHFTEVLRGSPFYNWYFRALGMKLGKDVYFEAVAVPDLDLVSVGDRTTVEQNVLLCAHSYEAPFLTRDPVVIGKGCVLRPASVTLPEFVMEDESQLESLQVGLKGMVMGRRDSLDS
jgi:non-ribosomal peptide synthetase-like protein